MILFPPCKINIGLDIITKRPDGHHDINTLMVPIIDLCDSLEIVRGGNDFEFSSSGLTIDCHKQDNIVSKAWMLMHEGYGIPNVKIHLHKVIPFGAGLGGGSADAAYVLRGINDLFSLGLSTKELEPLAAQLGSDVTFFLYTSPQYCSGRGEIMQPSNINLKGYYIIIIKPCISVSTAEAYAGITPHKPSSPLSQRLHSPISQWKELINNAFEATVFAAHPQLAIIKASLYKAGATYAAMSGSGSVIYGLFDHKPTYTPNGYDTELIGIYQL